MIFRKSCLYSSCVIALFFAFGVTSVEGFQQTPGKKQINPGPNNKPVVNPGPNNNPQVNPGPNNNPQINPGPNNKPVFNPGPNNAVRTHERLHGTLWIQTSLEHRMACNQAYSFAGLQLEKYLADKSLSAALEQRNGFSELPPAVVLDVDETVLDNSPFQARIVESDGDYVPDEWDKWVKEAKATAIPGAAAFIKLAMEKDVAVIFVTNRTAELEAKTILNLKTVFGIDVDKDMIHCKNEKPEWGSNKTSRRKFVCQSYRVVSLIGDDFNDFAWIGKTSPTDRIGIGSQFDSYWGEAWFLLPNPLYGNWEKAIYDYDYGTKRPDSLKLKYDLLDTKE